MKQRNYFAIDLGATSGRTILGTIANDRIVLEEITRFPNNLIQTGNHFYWDIYALYFEIVKGLKEVARRGVSITSIGIDTWGVDLVCVGRDGTLLRNPLSYRDPHTFEAMADYLANVKSQRELYDITGIQLLNFNTLFQLHAMRRNGDSAFENAEHLLFVPDALSWMLTGRMVCEYTIASTGELLNASTGDLDEELLHSVGVERSMFGPMVQPGDLIGTLTEELQEMTGLGAIPVYAVAGHDTASAVAAVPAKNERFAYLSSGTWSLMGIETRSPIISDRSYECNFTNEGGIEGTTRFLKNICGMWMLECCRREWGDSVPQDYATLFAEAMKVAPFRSMVNPDDKLFANPPSMEQAIKDCCRQTGQPVPDGYAEIIRCIFDSLALRYRQVFEWLSEMADFQIDTLHIIGGGSRNDYLNQFTSNATGLHVLAGPQEGTALGNIMVQAKACGDVADLWDMRRIIANSLSLVSYQPTDKESWAQAYERFLFLQS